MAGRRILRWLRKPGQQAEPGQTPPEQKPHVWAAPRALDVGLRTDTGPSREDNQDCVAVCRLHVGQTEEEEALLLALADGMGGHQQGDLASRLGVRTVLAQLIPEALLPFLLRDEEGSQQALRDLLEAAVGQAHKTVAQRVPHGGTTLTVALVLGTQAYLAHVGDSRAYLVRGGQAEQLTRDHSLVGRLLELGEISPDEVRTHPQRSLLYSALGQSAHPEVQFTTASLEESGAALLLCCDGLWDQLTDGELADTVTSAPSAQAACDRLVEEAIARGAADNVSAVLVRPQSGV